jgi:hypothetical protein
MVLISNISTQLIGDSTQLIGEISNIVEYKNGKIVERMQKKLHLDIDIDAELEIKTNISNNKQNDKCKQIFKKEVPIKLLYKFLDVVGEKEENCYKITKVSYKKADYNNKLKDILYELKEYYFQSKIYFVERKLDYIKFIRIIKQLCNYHNIKYGNKFLYSSSQYEIDYYIYLDPNNELILIDEEVI